MPESIAELHRQLTPDAWRESVGFSEDLQKANAQLFTASSREERIAALSAWLASPSGQPCIFGKAAAKLGLIRYCILDEADLSQSDNSVRDRIQAARMEWTHDAFDGKASAFIVLAISPKIANATPNEATKRLAHRLCYLYLLDDIVENTVYHDEVFLQMPSHRNSTWKWKAGVNYFCSQGDKRWWHDHRIPGGMGFSVNSVGHLAKSAKLATFMNSMIRGMNAQEEEWDASKIDSLEKALGFAMRTITNAAPTVSGPATQLLPKPANPSELPIQTCPYSLPRDLADRNFCEYSGHYHTDYTIPSEYFDPAIERPSEVRAHRLDFTYLFHNHVSNPAFITMGEGQPIRDDGEALAAKATKSFEESGFIHDFPHLEAALSRYAKPKV